MSVLVTAVHYIIAIVLSYILGFVLVFISHTESFRDLAIQLDSRIISTSISCSIILLVTTSSYLFDSAPFFIFNYPIYFIEEEFEKIKENYIIIICFPYSPKLSGNVHNKHSKKRLALRTNIVSVVHLFVICTFNL